MVEGCCLSILPAMWSGRSDTSCSCQLGCIRQGDGDEGTRLLYRGTLSALSLCHRPGVEDDRRGAAGGLGGCVPQDVGRSVRGWQVQCQVVRGKGSIAGVFHYKEVEMKKVAIGLLFSLVASVAYAACSTHTYFVNGRYVTCTTCCYGSNCNTNCF